MELNHEIVEEIKRYLAQVAAHLKELPGDEQAGILDDVERHIHDALARRTGGHPTLPELRAVLAEMDPPESYATRERQTAQTTSERPNLGAIALCVSLGSLLASGLVLVLARGLDIWIPYLFFMGGQLAGVVLGLRSWRQPLGKAAVLVSVLLMAFSTLYAS